MPPRPTATPAAAPDPVEIARLRRLELATDGAMRLSDVTEFLSISESAVLRLLDSGELVGGHLGRCRVVSRRSAQEYLAARLELIEAAP